LAANFSRLRTAFSWVDAYDRPGTSKRAPRHKSYPYLLRKLAIMRASQVWALDTTYIQMASAFADNCCVRISAIVDGCFSLIVDGRGKRASEGSNVSQSSTIRLKRCVAKRLLEVCGADLSTAAGVACDERATRWVSRRGRRGGGAPVSFVFGLVA